MIIIYNRLVIKLSFQEEYYEKNKENFRLGVGGADVGGGGAYGGYRIRLMGCNQCKRYFR